MLRAMVAAEQTNQKEPGATVEVIDQDDGAALTVLAHSVAEQVRLAFKPTDTLGHQALYSFMHPDPGRAGPLPSIPIMAGAQSERTGDRWLR